MNSTSMLRTPALGFLCLMLCGSFSAQTLHVPGGTVGNIGGSNVGIGTTNPMWPLQIGPDLVFASMWPTIGFNAYYDGSNIRLLTTGSGSYIQQHYASNGFAIFSVPTGTGGAVAPVTILGFYQQSSSGNVGIGTISPVQRLSVSGAHGGPATSGSASDAVARFGSGVTDLVLDFGVSGGAGAFTWLQARDQTSYANNHILSLNPNGGNVGIGTASPSHKLAVNGTIRAKEIIVDTGWSDYVFADDYRLAPLSEVESHIREKKHLPGIPSAAEIEAGGVSLGDMQAKLLAKVEELTLHAIAQNKRISALEEENRQLRSR